MNKIEAEDKHKSVTADISQDTAIHSNKRTRVDDEEEPPRDEQREYKRSKIKETSNNGISLRQNVLANSEDSYETSPISG